MHPVKFPEANFTFAKHQRQYKPLPCHLSENETGTVISCWQMNWRERLRVLVTGQVYLSQMTFHQPLQPISLHARNTELFNYPRRATWWAHQWAFLVAFWQTFIEPNVAPVRAGIRRRGWACVRGIARAASWAWSRVHQRVPDGCIPAHWWLAHAYRDFPRNERVFVLWGVHWLVLLDAYIGDSWNRHRCRETWIDRAVRHRVGAFTPDAVPLTPGHLERLRKGKEVVFADRNLRVYPTKRPVDPVAHAPAPAQTLEALFNEGHIGPNFFRTYRKMDNMKETMARFSDGLLSAREALIEFGVAMGMAEKAAQAFRLCMDQMPRQHPGQPVDLVALQALAAVRWHEWADHAPAPTDAEFCGNELAGEVGEACNFIKKIGRWTRKWRGGLLPEEAKPALAKELADVVICAANVANCVGINLSDAVRQKFNETSDKHGFRTKM